MRPIKLFLFLLLGTVISLAQTGPDAADNGVIMAPAAPPQTITSTPTGGNWGSSSTWVGGMVPTNFDKVIITAGATVVIDINAQAASVTVGNAANLETIKQPQSIGIPRAWLTFLETAGESLTVGSELRIESNGEFSTGGGTVDFHTVTIGGNLTNNGILDLSTNNNQAGATITFAGDTSVAFDGTGPVTDISRILMKKGSANNTVELRVSNFTVQGRTTDGPGSGFLFLFGGVFKISGTFAGSHRTFGTDAYDPPEAAGFWLNNPNYTVVGRPGDGTLNGPFRLTAGEFNVGTSSQHGFITRGTFIVGGGKLNVAGRMFVIGNTVLALTGGKITTCIMPGTGCTVSVSRPLGGPITMSAGEIVLQNSGKYDQTGTASEVITYGNAAVRFGNELTIGSGNFEVGGFVPNVVVDTSSGVPQTLATTNANTVHIKNLEIQPGGIFRAQNLSIHGTSIVNNGQLETLSGFTIGRLEFDDLTGLSDIAYTGTGTAQGYATDLYIHGRSFTFSQTVGNITARNLHITNAHVVGANRLTVGRSDAGDTLVEMFDGASLDVAPAFDLGPGGERVTYRGPSTSGPEINPSRVLTQLTLLSPDVLTITGGDLVAVTLTFNNNGVIKTGGATISTQLPFSTPSAGYVDGNVRMQLSTGHSGHSYRFPVGQNGSTPVTVTIMSVTGPSALTIRAVDMTLPGLDPTVSASRYWSITEEGGNVIARLAFTPASADINGNQANYLKWLKNGGAPVAVTATDIDQLTGDWGLGERLAPASVSVSGSVTTSTGMPIRGATVTISGGGLPAPLVTSTGNFGTYLFDGLPTGGTFTVEVSAKRYRFTTGSQVVTANNNVSNVNFAANPQD